MYARVENNSGVKTIFLGNYTIDNGTAECVFEMLVKVLKEWSIADRQVVRRSVSDDRSTQWCGCTTVSLKLRAPPVFGTTGAI